MGEISIHDVRFGVSVIELTRTHEQLKACRAILHDLHARMVDVYDGSSNGVNHLTFTGGDIRDIEEALR